jgi:hypothetical protein
MSRRKSRLGTRWPNEGHGTTPFALQSRVVTPDSTQNDVFATKFRNAA